MSKKYLAIFIILFAILLDQVIKIYIKTHFYLGEEVKIFDWFIIHFTENNGMAMGFEFGGKTGKLFLTLFRIVAIFGIIYWLKQMLIKQAPKQVIIAIALIFSGAVGNIIDSVFYGVIFNSSAHKVATIFPEEPYGSLLYGKVVDMFYFPFFTATFPDWVPFIGGDLFRFFNYIFNPADAFISVGVFLLFIYSKQAFPKNEVN